VRIAVFDSGIGGITVLNEAIKSMPGNEYIYYADTNNVPYGTKPKEQVKNIIFNAVEFISKLDIDALVIACNTATSIAAEDLRSLYSFPIIGMEPAVKPAIKIGKENRNRILVFATPLTLKEHKFINLVERIDEEKIVDYLPLPELVEYAEAFEFSQETFFSYLDNKLNTFDLTQYSAVVLGCTHFVLYKDLFNKYLPSHISVIDGNKGTVSQLERVLASIAITTDESINSLTSNVSFYTSGILMDEEYKLKIFQNSLLSKI
jgi:glutamate racemase